MNTFYLNLGSNIDPENNILAALQLIDQNDPIISCSQFYQTPPYHHYHYLKNTPPFINCAIKLYSDTDLNHYKQVIIPKIETHLHRVKDPHNIHADRSIDIDITLFNDAVIPDKKIPDPLIPDCTHIILPLAEIAADYVHPILGTTISNLKDLHLKQNPVYQIRGDIRWSYQK